MALDELSRVRASLVPSMTDTWADIAARVLPGVPQDEAVGQLKSWNLHVFMRASNTRATANPFLPSDIVFIEPPLPL